MAQVVVLGAGLGGTIMAYELREKLGKAHDVAVVTKGATYSFVPSNPWVAVGWRDRKAVEVELEPVLKRRGIALHPQGATRLHPAERRIELGDGTSLAYDYLVIATGPELAFDEIEGFGPEAHTQLDLPGRSRRRRQGRLRRGGGQARPGDHRRGAGRLVLRAGL